jgi:dihydroneopterin aldolase
MALIALEGMKFYAFHGVYEAERVLGNDYVVDVTVETGIAVASASDSIR